MTSDSGPGARFRESTRAPVDAPVTLQLDAFTPPQSGHSGNVSVGGMFVSLQNPLPVGTIVRFELGLGDTGQPVRGTAEVAWIRTRGQGPGQPAGMGLQFRFLEGDGDTRVRAAVAKIVAEKGLAVETNDDEEQAAARRRQT